MVISRAFYEQVATEIDDSVAENECGDFSCAAASTMTLKMKENVRRSSDIAP